MRTAANKVGCAHDRLDRMLPARFGRIKRGWKFGQPDAMPAGSRNVLGRGIVVAGQNRADLVREGHYSSLVLRAVSRRDFQKFRKILADLLVAHLDLAAQICLQRGGVAKLALTGGMVHHADKADTVILAEIRQFLQQGLRTDFGAQVQEMADLQRLFVSLRDQFAGKLSGVRRVILAIRDRADAHRIKNRSYPAACKLCIMGIDRCCVRPVHAGAGLDVAFKVIGMQLDQSRRDIITAAINCVSGHRTLSDFAKHTVTDHDMAFHHLIGQDQRRMGQDGFLHCHIQRSLSMSDYRRYAIYYTPPKGAFADFGAAWLGWDAVSGMSVRQPDVPGLDMAAISEQPRKYGFHATLKAPFRLVDEASVADLFKSIEALAAKLAPVTLDGLKLSQLGSFLALIPHKNILPLQDLASAVVTGLDELRAPLSVTDMARRNPDLLTEQQRAHLIKWGYPYVMDEFRFHMTLTGSLEDDVLQKAKAALEPRLGILPSPLVIEAISLVGEADDGRFHVLNRFVLCGSR